MMQKCLMLLSELQMQPCSQNEKAIGISLHAKNFDYAEYSKLDRLLKNNVRTQVSYSL